MILHCLPKLLNFFVFQRRMIIFCNYIRFIEIPRSTPHLFLMFFINMIVNSMVVVLSQNEEWCFSLHFTHRLLLRHSEVQCLVPVQLKLIFFSESISLRSSISLTVMPSLALCPDFSQQT